MPELYQASCVAIAGRAVLIEGAPGSGKSSLALALIDRGALLVGDDSVTLEDRGRTLWAAPPPNIAGKLEIRGVGIVELQSVSAPVAMVLTLAPAPPRFVEQADTIQIASHAIPHLQFFADSPVAALRAEHALALHGLSTP